MAVWSVVAGGGTISATGLFTASSTAGTFLNTVKATANGIASTFATVTVLPGALATLTVTPNPASVAAGATRQFTAVGTDAAGNVVPVSPTWSVVGGGGTIDATGLFTAGAVPGTYTNTVSASSGLVTGTASVVVTAGTLATITITPNPALMIAAGTQQFTAVGKDFAGNAITITPVWSVSSTGSGASITQTGLYTAGSIAGVFTNEVVATSGLVSGTASVVVSGGPPTNSGFLGTAARFGVLAGAGVRCGASGAVNGPAADIGSSPTATVTGFPTPCTLTGAIVIPADAALGQTDLATAYTSLQGMTGCADISGVDLSAYGALNSLPPGCYTFATSAALSGTLALRGSSSAQWTFRVATTLDINPGASVILSGGAIPDNVRWVVGTTATLKAGSHTEGNVLAGMNIVLQSGATLTGRALAQSGSVDMTLGGAVVTKP